jgi:SanA protein
MIKKMMTILINFTLACIFIGAFILIVSRIFTSLYSLPKTYTKADVPEKSVAIVFGAGLRKDGSPTLVLQDRIETAVALYKDHRVEKLLMSGDNRFANYDEPSAMAELAMSLGVPEEDIVLDFAGRRTYDTCYRASQIFGLNEAILITQKFHLPRSLFLCNSLGIESIGVAANNNYFLKRTRLFWQFRETFATVTALWDVWFRHPLPVLGEYEPIFPNKPKPDTPFHN